MLRVVAKGGQAGGATRCITPCSLPLRAWKFKQKNGFRQSASSAQKRIPPINARRERFLGPPRTGRRHLTHLTQGMEVAKKGGGSRTPPRRHSACGRRWARVARLVARRSERATLERVATRSVRRAARRSVPVGAGPWRPAARENGVQKALFRAHEVTGFLGFPIVMGFWKMQRCRKTVVFCNDGGCKCGWKPVE